jgi:hypothetical protein
VEKYDTVTDPSGEEQDVRKEMTVQVEQWWNSSDVGASLREENAWVVDPYIQHLVYPDPVILQHDRGW